MGDNLGNCGIPIPDNGAVVDSLDGIAAGLRGMRAEAGNVSYAEIATRINRRRRAGGLNPHAASVSRHTVYDCFQDGRKRINVQLVWEIVFALVGDEKVADEWRTACLAAQTKKSNTAAVSSQADANAVGQPETAPQISNDAIGIRQIRDIRETAAAVISDIKAPGKIRRSPQFYAAFMMLGIAFNVLPMAIFHTSIEHFPLFADTIGTALIAILFGPIWGIATALVSGLVSWGLSPVFGWEYDIRGLAFILVAMVAALIWGLGVHKYGMSRSLLRFSVLNLFVALACSATVALIILPLFHGDLNHGFANLIADQFREIGTWQMLAGIGANLFISVIDKALAGLIALLLAGGLFRKFAPPSVVALTSPINTTHLRNAIDNLAVGKLAWIRRG